MVFSIVVLAKEHHDSMASTNGLAQWFERDFLFGYGRHFWNSVGVAGFSLMASGAILAFESQLPSPEPNVRKYEESAEQANIQWYDYQYLKDDLCAFKVPNMTEVDEQLCTEFNSWVRQGHPRGNKSFFNKKGNWTAGGSIWARDWVRGFMYDPRHKQSRSRYIQQDEEARARYASDKTAKAVRLGLSLPLAASGLGLVVSASLMSAVLSIERNTRKE